MPYSPFIGEEGYQSDKYQHKGDEPPCFPPRRKNRDGEAYAFLFTFLIRAEGFHLQLEGSCRDVGESDDSVGTDIQPLVLKAFEAVLALYFIHVGKVRYLDVEGEVGLSVLELNLRFLGEGRSV